MKTTWSPEGRLRDRRRAREGKQQKRPKGNARDRLDNKSRLNKLPNNKMPNKKSQ